MQKINNRPYDQSDIVLANMVGVTPMNFVQIMSKIDEDQANSIMTRLLSDHDKEIKEGIQMFKDLM